MRENSLTYLNGRVLPTNEASLSLTDAGFVWGATVVDRLRTFRHKLFRLTDHLARFRQSCERAFIPQPHTDQELATIAGEMVERAASQLNKEDELSLILFATPGNETGPTLGMTMERLDFTKYAALVRSGAKLAPVPSPAGVDPAIKHRSRLAWWIATRGLPTGCEALFTTGEPHHFLRETPIANFLAVIDGQLISPPRSTILDGISLHQVEILAQRLGIRFIEREMTIDEVLAKSTECILANTSFCLATVTSLSGQPKPLTGPTFQRLLRAWSDEVGVDILHQFESNR